METKYITLNDQIRRVVKTPVDQGRIVAMAVALAVSARAMLPSSEVENLADYYANQVAPMARAAISDIGEGVIFSTKTALEYVSQFWKMRYSAAFPATALADTLRFAIANQLNPTRVLSYDFSMMWSGGVAVLSQETAGFLNQYKVEIIQLTAVVLPLLQPSRNDGEDSING